MTRSRPTGKVMLLLSLFISIFMASAASAAERYDMAAAIEYCDDTALEPIEGIWEFPDDQTAVLIRKIPGEPYRFEIFTLRSPDCRLNTGDLLGTLIESPETSKLRMSLYSKQIGGILSDSRECLAEFSDKEGTIRIRPKKFKLSLRTNRLLPGYWKAISISKENPLERLPVGLIRVFPNQGHSASNPRKPCYY